MRHPSQHARCVRSPLRPIHAHVAICDLQSTIFHSCGGIAQLVERQLCKLEVRGSNPLASSLRSQRGGERRLSRRNFSEGGRFLVLPYRRGELDSASQFKSWPTFPTF